MSHHAGASHVENTVAHTKYQCMYCTVLMAPLPFLPDHPFVLQAVIIIIDIFLRRGQERAGNNNILILFGSILSTQLSGVLSFYVLWYVCCVSVVSAAGGIKHSISTSVCINKS